MNKEYVLEKIAGIFAVKFQQYLDQLRNKPELTQADIIKIEQEKLKKEQESKK